MYRVEEVTVGEKKWWSKAFDVDHPLSWYICNSCKTAGADSTRAIQHHEHCPNQDNTSHGFHYPPGAVRNPEADEWLYDYVEDISDGFI